MVGTNVTWRGKRLFAEITGDGNMEYSIANMVASIDVFPAPAHIATLQDTLKEIGESPVEDWIPGWWPFSSKSMVDDKLSMQLVYPKVQDNPIIVRDVIDPIRPVTEASLEAAGISVPEGIGSLEDLWIGRTLLPGGLLFDLFSFGWSQRVLVLYFALHFDRNNVEYS